MRSHKLKRTEVGAALVMALVFLLVLTLLGISSLNTSALQEKMAGNVQDRNYAFQAAESALITGENLIGSSISINTVVADSSITTDGLHKPSTTSTPVWDEGTPIWTTSTDVRTLSGILTKVASAPKFIIEDVGQIEDVGGSLKLPTNYKSAGKNLFRITSRGTGGTNAAVVIVQSTYEKRF